MAAVEAVVEEESSPLVALEGEGTAEKMAAVQAAASARLSLHTN